jgi:glyoxylase-like metal-dependent hydrolase (beta-lactamase superfamily II)
VVTDEPFRIAGNLYYVGAVDMAAFLLTGPVGHVLIDGGWPETAPAIIGSIAAPGFEITDVKVLPKSHAHSDHAGVLHPAGPWCRTVGERERGFPHGGRPHSRLHLVVVPCPRWML